MLVMAVMLAAGVAADGDFHPWATFSRGSPMLGTVETAEIETRGIEPGAHRLRLAMRLTWRRLGKVTVTQWADSDSCPAVRDTVFAMRTLPVPHVAPPGLGDDGSIVLDGTSYSFDGPASGSNGHVAFSTNVGTPLAAWVDARLAALASCWKPAKS